MLALLLLAPALLPAQEPAPDLGAAVREVVRAKCLSCHEPESEDKKARRDFDKAWDLREVADEWGDPFDPDFSPLWEVVEDGSMPPKDSDVPPLTEAEAAAVLAWLEAGMPMPEDGNPFVDLGMAARYLPTLEAAPVEEAPELSFVQRLSRWSGRQHAATTHFPVALLFLAGALRLLGRGERRERLRSYEGFCLAVGAPLAVLTGSLGWLNAWNSGAGGEELFWHRWVGVALTVLALALLFLRRAHRERAWYGALLLLLAFLVAAGGHLGGELVYGEAYLAFWGAGLRAGTAGSGRR